jgi:hypothetical protein
LLSAHWQALFSIRAWDDWDRAGAPDGSAWPTGGPGVPGSTCQLWSGALGAGSSTRRRREVEPGHRGCAVRMSASEAEEGKRVRGNRPLAGLNARAMGTGRSSLGPLATLIFFLLIFYFFVLYLIFIYYGSTRVGYNH